jgi:hypothetical protein
MSESRPTESHPSRDRTAEHVQAWGIGRMVRFSGSSCVMCASARGSLPPASDAEFLGGWSTESWRGRVPTSECLSCSMFIATASLISFQSGSSHASERGWMQTTCMRCAVVSSPGCAVAVATKDKLAEGGFTLSRNRQRPIRCSATPRPRIEP